MYIKTKAFKCHCQVVLRQTVSKSYIIWFIGEKTASQDQIEGLTDIFSCMNSNMRTIYVCRLNKVFYL